MEKVKINLPDIVGKGYASFWHSKKKFRVVKGGRSSKKSKTTALWYIYNIMKYPLANAVVVRNTGNTHKDSTFAELKWAAEKLSVYHLWKFTENPLECTYLPTGQKILFRGFDDPLKLTSLTVSKGFLCWAWFEEAYEIESQSDFETFCEGIRGELPEGYFKQITLTYNPWINSHWTKEMFWDVEREDTFRLTTTHKCNEFLSESDHAAIEELAVTNPDRYKVVGLGEYGIPGGAFFDEFRTDIHTTEPFVIPDHWHRYITMDYGLDMLACYWIAIDTQNNAYVYKELHESNLIISEAARRIKQVNGNDRIKIKYAPPDLQNRRQETGKSAFDIFRDNGEVLTKSDNNRVAGWLALKEWLKVIEVRDEQTGEVTKTAKMKIFKNCTNLIRCLSQIQCDEKDPNDAATTPHDVTHAPESIRYFAVMRQVTPQNSAKQVTGVWARGELKMAGYKDYQINRMAKTGQIKLIGR